MRKLIRAWHGLVRKAKRLHSKLKNYASSADLG